MVENSFHTFQVGTIYNNPIKDISPERINLPIMNNFFAFIFTVLSFISLCILTFKALFNRVKLNAQKIPKPNLKLLRKKLNKQYPSQHHSIHMSLIYLLLISMSII